MICAVRPASTATDYLVTSCPSCALQEAQNSAGEKHCSSIDALQRHQNSASAQVCGHKGTKPVRTSAADMPRPRSCP